MVLWGRGEQNWSRCRNYFTQHIQPFSFFSSSGTDERLICMCVRTLTAKCDPTYVFSFMNLWRNKSSAVGRSREFLRKQLRIQSLAISVILGGSSYLGCSEVAIL